MGSNKFCVKSGVKKFKEVNDIKKIGRAMVKKYFNYLSTQKMCFYALNRSICNILIFCNLI